MQTDKRHANISLFFLAAILLLVWPQLRSELRQIAATILRLLTANG